MPSYLRQLPDQLRLADLRIADLIDILVIAIMIYAGLSWFRDRASRAVATGFILIGLLFLCAQWLQMYATLMLFQVGFTALLLSLVVIFQEDIRRGFERLTLRQWLQGAQRPEVDLAVVDVISETVHQLAEQRIGALLVFGGREGLERHMRGGVPVDAIVSMPLLCSIFNADSPGHDGAVIVDAERVERLGVHLPLTSNLNAIEHGGTRHAAALGLSEKCDALVLVVSEERGTISFAEQGQLQLVSPKEVARRLRDWYQQHYARKKESPIARFTRSAGLKAAAVVLACLAWFLLAYRVDTLQKTIIIPVEYRNLSEGWVVAEPRPSHAQLTLSGSERAFDMLDAGNLVVSFDLDFVTQEQTYYLSTIENLTDIPEELRVGQVEPARVEIVVSRREPSLESPPTTPPPES